MPRRRSSFKTRAPKRNLFWTGFNRMDFLQDATQSESVIWDQASSSQNFGSKLLCERILGTLWVMPGAGTADCTLSAYIKAFGTDETETVPTGAPFTTQSQDIDVHATRLLWQQFVKMPPFDEKPVQLVRLDIDVKAKVKLANPARSLLLVTDGVVTNTTRVSGQLRCLLSY